MLPPDKVKQQIDYWNEGADHDFSMAKDIHLKAERHVGALFFLHLSLEKALKAAAVKHQQEYAPMVHNLLGLARKAGLLPDPDQERALAEINEFNLETRYPDSHNELFKRASKELTAKLLKKGEELLAWIRQN